MGMFLIEHDIYIATLMEQLNLRFAPAAGPLDGPGGMEEMLELQEKFHIFSEEYSFRDSVAVLGLGGSLNWSTKNRWFTLLDWLKTCPSETGQNGNDRIVSVLREHLAQKDALPVHFAIHDMRTDPRVIVRPNDHPIFYMNQKYLTISLPMKPRAP